MPGQTTFTALGTEAVVAAGGGTSVLNNALINTYAREGFVLWRSADVDVTTTAQRGRDPVFSGLTRKARTVIVDHEVAPGADVGAARRYARSLYTPRLGAQVLVFNEDGVEKRLWVKMIRLLPHDSGNRICVAQGEWLILSTVYAAHTASSTAAASKSSSPATVAVSNAGTEPSPFATYTFKPTAAKSAANGQRYRLCVTVVNNAPRDLIHHPISVAIDHAAEVSASRSQANGNDVEMHRDHIRLMRWAGAGTSAFNQTGCRVWFADDLPAARSWTDSGGATIGAGDTTFYTNDALTHMPPLPFWAVLDSEVVQVTAYDAQAGTITIGRGKRASTAATHAAGSELKLAVAYDLVYGGTSLTAQKFIDNAYKPLPAEHQSSTNNAWTFAYYQQTPADADTQTRLPRPGSWRTARRPFPDWTQREDMYGNWIPRTASRTSDVALATAMCITYKTNGATAGHPLVDRWETYFGIGVSQIDFNEDTATLSQLVPNEGRLFVYGYGRDGSEVRLAAYHSDAPTAKTLSPSPSIIGMAFAVRPHDPKDTQDNPTGSSVGSHEPDDNDGFVIAANMVVTFDSAERLTVLVSSRQDCYQIGRPNAAATWANADGETLSIWGPVLALNDTLTIDVDARTAQLGDGTSVAHVLTGDWPRIPADADSPPANTNLTYVEAGIGALDIGVPSFRSCWT